MITAEAFPSSELSYHSFTLLNYKIIFGSLCLHYFLYKSIHKLCVKTQAVKLGFKANRNLIINIAFFSVWGFLTAGGANMAVLNIDFMLRFI